MVDGDGDVDERLKTRQNWSVAQDVDRRNKTIVGQLQRCRCLLLAMAIAL